MKKEKGERKNRFLNSQLPQSSFSELKVLNSQLSIFNFQLSIFNSQLPALNFQFKNYAYII